MGQHWSRQNQGYISSVSTSIRGLRSRSSISSINDARGTGNREDMTHILQRTFSVDQNLWQKLTAQQSKERTRSIFWITPTLNPFRPIPIVWMAFIMLLDATYTAFLIPWNIAFRAGTWDDYIDIIIGSFFIIDYIVNMHMGFLVTLDGERKLIRDGKQVVLFYIRRGTFIVDTITVISYIAQTIIFLAVTPKNRTLSFILEAARLIRLVRVYRVIKELFLSSLSGRNFYAIPISSTFIYLLGILYVTLVLVNFLGCIWYFGADISEGGLHESWVADNGLIDHSIGTKYLASIYFSMTTITTVGYGDITPTNSIEQIIAMMMQMIGVVFFGFLVGSATELMSNYSKGARRGTLYREKMMEVQEWMAYRRIPRKLGQKIKIYYGDVWVKQQDYSEQEIVDDMPDDLRAEVVYQITRKLFRNLPVFDELPDDLLVQIAARLQPIKRTRGFNLCQHGDEANCIWLLQSGTVHTIINTEHVDEFSAPDVLGVPCLLQDKDPRCGVRMSTYQCVLPCELWQLEVQDLRTLENQIVDLRLRLLRGVRKHLANALLKYGSAARSFKKTAIYNMYSNYNINNNNINNIPHDKQQSPEDTQSNTFVDPSMRQAFEALIHDDTENSEYMDSPEISGNNKRQYIDNNKRQYIDNNNNNNNSSIVIYGDSSIPQSPQSPKSKLIPDSPESQSQIRAGINRAVSSDEIFGKIEIS